MAAAAAAPEDLEKRASDAFIDDNFQLSADLYSQALVMDPMNANLLASRAQANIKLRNYTDMSRSGDITWKHCTKVDSSGKVQCSYCGKVMSGGGDKDETTPGWSYRGGHCM